MLGVDYGLAGDYLPKAFDFSSVIQNEKIVQLVLPKKYGFSIVCLADQLGRVFCRGDNSWGAFGDGEGSYKNDEGLDISIHHSTPIRAALTGIYKVNFGAKEILPNQRPTATTPQLISSPYLLPASGATTTPSTIYPLTNLNNAGISALVPPAAQANPGSTAPHNGPVRVNLVRLSDNYATNNLIYTYSNVPSVPRNLQIEPAGPAVAAIQASWQPPISDGGSPITDYKIEYCIANNDKTACQDPTASGNVANPINWVAFAHAPSTTTTVAIGNLDAAKTYLVRVAAVNQNGQGPYAAMASSLPSFVSLAVDPDLLINVNPVHNATYSSAKLSIKLATNLTAGYSLKMATTGDDRLNHTSIPGKYINPTSHQFATPGYLAADRWGFYIPNTARNQQYNSISYAQFTTSDAIYTNQSNPGVNYTKVSRPGQALTIAQYDQALLGDKFVDLIFGVGVSKQQISGHYRQIIRFEMIGN